MDQGHAQDSTRASSGLGLALGLVLSVLLSAALVISAAKAGITPGVSPLVVLVGWVALGKALGPRLKGFLAIFQVTGSAGAAVTAGVVFTAPIIQILHAELGLPVPPVDAPLLIVAALAGSALGFGFVGLATKRFLSDPRLPAPEAVACDRLIETAVDRPDERPALMSTLVAGLVAGFAINGLLVLEWLENKVTHLTFGVTSPTAGAAGEPVDVEVDLPLPVAPLYLGIGALLTLPTAFLLFMGGFVNAVTTGYAAAHAMPPTTFRWVGGAAMVVAVVYSLVAYAVEGRKQAKLDAAAESGVTGAALAAAIADTSLLEQTKAQRRLLVGSIAVGLAGMIAMMGMVGGSTTTLAVMGAVAFVLVWLLSGLGGLLSLQVGSSASPVSGTVFMGMLVLSIAALGIGLEGISGVVFLVPLVVAACVAICAANDSSQDYKTMQLNGFRVADGFPGQLLGLAGGAIIVPITLWMAHEAFTLGSDDLPAPQASFFATVLRSLFLEADLPWGPISAGAVLGVVAVLVEVGGKAKGLILSSLAFAVGIYLPSYIGTGILLGALARFLATRRIQASTHEGILTAAGLITGDAFASLILAGLVIGQMDEGLRPALGDAQFPLWLGRAGLVIMLLLVTFNYARRSRSAPRS